MGLEISKLYSYSFNSISAILHDDIGYHDGILAITNLCNILNAADHRVKLVKIWGSRSFELHMYM